MSEPLHGCGDQSGWDEEGPWFPLPQVGVMYDVKHDCFWLIGNGNHLRLPATIRLDRKECGTNVVP